MKKLAYLFAYILPILGFASVARGGWWLLSVPIFVFVLIPFFDLFLGHDRINADEAGYGRLKNDRYYRYLTWLAVPLQVVLVIWGADQVTQVGIGLWQQLGITASIGVVTGAFGITLAHELGHRHERFEQILAQIMLGTVTYMHFFIEHNLGHHANVGTPKDPATSRLGESFYRFYPRTVIGSWRSAWRIETARLQKKGHSLVGLHNRMLWYLALPLLFACVLAVVFGPLAFAYFFLQSWLAFSLLEIINYVEHYGLQRKSVGDGRYERVQPHHSWNASERLTNAFLFDLQKHSDHHANAGRRYQTLRHYDHVPQLPTGYGGMILLALVPPLWFRVMNQRVAMAAQ